MFNTQGFQFNFENDAYQPQIMKFSGNLSGVDVLRYGESVVNLVYIDSLMPIDEFKNFHSKWVSQSS